MSVYEAQNSRKVFVAADLGEQDDTPNGWPLGRIKARSRSNASVIGGLERRRTSLKPERIGTQLAGEKVI